ncbi:AtuA-related protein [Brevibacterium linens]|uniref:AtuA-related protein n=1 Tax=Brevibacterium linens TaxID=1703 RepID=UPI0035134788
MTTKSEQAATVDDLATVRTGDKGDTLILGVVARDGVDFSDLSRAITEEAVADHFGVPVSRVKRSLLSGLNAMSFELKGMLGSGVTGVSHLDGHGKTLSYHLLTMQVTR